MNELIYELKTAAQVTEGQPCRVSKSALLDAIRALRALEEIAIMPVGINWPAEATRMRELAREATK
jgi:hypothetical protein